MLVLQVALQPLNLGHLLPHLNNNIVQVALFNPASKKRFLSLLVSVTWFLPPPSLILMHPPLFPIP